MKFFFFAMTLALTVPLWADSRGFPEMYGCGEGVLGVSVPTTDASWSDYDPDIDAIALENSAAQPHNDFLKELQELVPTPLDAACGIVSFEIKKLEHHTLRTENNRTISVHYANGEQVGPVVVESPKVIIRVAVRITVSRPQGTHLTFTWAVDGRTSSKKKRQLEVDGRVTKIKKFNCGSQIDEVRDLAAILPDNIRDLTQPGGFSIGDFARWDGGNPANAFGPLRFQYSRQNPRQLLEIKDGVNVLCSVQQTPEPAGSGADRVSGNEEKGASSESTRGHEAQGDL